MRVDEAKKLVEELQLAPEVLDRANEILEGLSDDYVLDDQRLDKLIALVDLEMEMAQIEAETCEQTVGAMGEFLEEVNKASEKAAREINLLTDRVLNQGKQKLEVVAQDK